MYSKKGSLVVGITKFEPMNCRESDDRIGFDADSAAAFAGKLGDKVESIEINRQSDTELKTLC